MNDIQNTKHNSQYKWIIVTVFFFYNGIGWGVTQASSGVYFNPIAESLDLSRTAMSATFATLLAIGFSCAVLWGKLTDSWNIRWVLAMSGCCLSAGFFLGSLSQSLSQFIASYCIIGGLGLAGTFSPLTGTTMRWFAPHQRGFALGLSISGVGVGTAIMPILADYLIYTKGWNYTFQIFGIIMLVLTCMAALLAKEPPKPPAEKLDPKITKNANFTMASIVKDQKFWMIFGMNITMVTILQMCLVHLVPRAIDAGIDTSTAAKLMSMLGFASVLGKAGGGYLSDNLGPNKVYITAVSLIICLLISINLSDSLWLYCVFAAGFGIGYGACIMQSNLISVRLFGTAKMSTITGVLSQGNVVGGTVGPIMAGLLFDLTGSYTIPFTAASFIGLLGIFFCIKANAPYKANP